MFSGIVEELVKVDKISKQGKVTLIKVRAEKVLADTKIGDSIAVDGVCLTVVKKEKDALSFEAMPETIKLTTLGRLKIADKVNLERSLKVGDRISGHFVSGHVDCIGTIRRKTYIEGNLAFEIAIPTKHIDLVIPKGSVTIDGISLTVVKKRSNMFSVYIIPHTLKNTTLSFKGPSHKVNVEIDLLVKYARNNKK